MVIRNDSWILRTAWAAFGIAVCITIGVFMNAKPIPEAKLCVRASWVDDKDMEYVSMNIEIPENMYHATVMQLLPNSYCK